ncbi:hypothetical protein [Streptomyces anthocyanicus]|uniref:hypothetical protein n=1 Tax=Streptomyces anthocyanicus TaxID=68174 RepID=UPI0038136328
MPIAEHSWPLHYPGSDESVLPELLDEARKAEESGGLVLYFKSETAWHIFHVRVKSS